MPHHQHSQYADKSDHCQSDPECQKYIAQHPVHTGKSHQIHLIQLSYHRALKGSVDRKQHWLPFWKPGKIIQHLFTLTDIFKPDLLTVVLGDAENSAPFLTNCKNAGLIFSCCLFQDCSYHFFPV